MERPALWNASEWADLQPLCYSAKAQAHLRMIVDLEPPPDATVDDVISSILLAPQTWKAHCFGVPGALRETLGSTTTGISATFDTAIGTIKPWATSGWDFDFIDGLCDDLTASLEGQVNTRLRQRYGNAENLCRAWDYVFTCEQTVTSFLIAQLMAFILPQLSHLLFNPDRGQFSITGELTSHRVQFGASSPEINFGYEMGTDVAVRLISGQVKKITVATLAVFRWILWCCRHEPREFLAKPRPVRRDNRDDPSKQNARKILRQIWLQQVENRLFFTYLTNGTHYIFFRAGEVRPQILASRIYDNDGFLDPYTGDSDTPPLWIPTPMEARPPIRPFRIIIALLKRASDLTRNQDYEERLWWPPAPHGPPAPPPPPANPPPPPANPPPPPPGDDQSSQKRPKTSNKPSRESARHANKQGMNFKLLDIAELTVEQSAPNLGLHKLVAVGPQGPFSAIPWTGKASRFPKEAKRMSSRAQREQVDLLKASFETWEGSGAFGDGFTGRLWRSDWQVPCFFKVVKADTFDTSRYPLAQMHLDKGIDFPCHPDSAMAKLMAEAKLLHELSYHKITPYPYGVWMGSDKLGSGMVGFIAMERCENEDQNEEFHDFDEADKSAIREIFHRLHSVGYVHGDLRRRHVLRKVDRDNVPIAHEWRLIDLDRARKVDPKADAEEIAHENRLVELMLDEIDLGLWDICE